MNRKINPSVQYTGASISSLTPKNVANHLNTLIPVGTAITMVVAVKYLRVSTSMPMVNIWCAQTKKPKSPILAIA